MCDIFKRNFLFESLEVPCEVIEDVVTLVTSRSILKKLYEPKVMPLGVTEDVGDLIHDYEHLSDHYEIREDPTGSIEDVVAIKDPKKFTVVPGIESSDGDIDSPCEDCPEDEVGVEKCQVLRWKSFTVNLVSVFRLLV